MSKVREQGYEDTDSKSLDVMKQYWRSIEQYPLLTADEEMRLGNIMCGRDPETGITTDDVLALVETQIGVMGVENDENFPIEA